MPLPDEACLLVLGASVRAAAASGIRAGYRVIGADLFGDIDTRETTQFLGTAASIPELPTLAQTVPNQIPCLLTGGFENHPEAIEQLSRQRPCLNSPPKAVSRARDPLLLQQILHQHGLPTTPTWIPEPTGGSGRQPTARPSPRPPGWPNGLDGTWLSKPLAGAGGLGIRPCSAGTSRTDDHERLPGTPSVSREIYCQAQLHGVPIGAVYLAEPDTTTRIGFSWQLSGTDPAAPGPFVYCGSIGPVSLPDRISGQIDVVAGTLAHTLGLRGVFGIDGVLNERGFHLVELNPRYPASLELFERSSGTSWLRRHGRAFQPHAAIAATDTWAAPPRAEPPIVARQIVYAPQNSVIELDLAELVGSPMAHHGDQLPALADVPPVGSQIPRSAPVCTILVQGQSIRDCAENLAEQSRRLYSNLRWSGVHQPLVVPEFLERLIREG